MPRINNNVPKECVYCRFYSGQECQGCKNKKMFIFNTLLYAICEKCGKVEDINHMAKVLIKQGKKLVMKYYCSDCRHNSRLTYSELTGRLWDGTRKTIKLYQEFGCPTNTVDHEIKANRHIFKCEKCGNYFESDIATPKYRICKACETSHRNSYGYKPDPLFFGNSKKVRFGIELETEGAGTKNDELSILLHKEGLPVYCKKDGSLSNYGCEIVSHPADLATLQKVFKKICQLANLLGCTSWESGHCGLHMHINREDLESVKFTGLEKYTNDSRVTWEYVISYFFEKFRGCWEIVAGRRGNSYSKWNCRESFDLANLLRCISYSDRYRAVNITNSNTIELRIFRGTINYRSISTIFWMVDNFIAKIRKVHNFAKLDSLNFVDFFPKKKPSFIKNSRAGRAIFNPRTATANTTDIRNEEV